MTQQNDFPPLYKAAIAADDAFHAGLVKEYGKNKAGYNRYLPDNTYPAWLQELSAAKKKADEEWLAEMQKPKPKRMPTVDANDLEGKN